jgi:hypothetical protein
MGRFAPVAEARLPFAVGFIHDGLSLIKMCHCTDG